MHINANLQSIDAGIYVDCICAKHRQQTHVDVIKHTCARFVNFFNVDDEPTRTQAVQNNRKKLNEKSKKNSLLNARVPT